ncbi:MAG: tyrosine-type recombinase/integrase [Chloroflexi bacterium]|nr:tyrosine-type recombinase/integrase [Chloroflexota bacterium]
MNSKPSGLEALIGGFKLSCQVEGKSPKTVEWYLSFLGRFQWFLHEEHLPNDVANIGKDHVRAFVRYLQSQAKIPQSGKPLSGATVQGYVRTLKAFFSWASREGYVSSNPMANVPVPKAPSKVITTFSQDQFAALVGLCLSSDREGRRNLAILFLLLDTGIRVSELVNIDSEDVDLAEGSIRIRVAKGSKERVVPIGSLAQKSLWKYMTAYRPQPLTGQVKRLFLSERGLPLTKSGIQQMLRRYGRSAGLTMVRCSPHTFRHTFAKDYLMNGGDIFSLQKILGHSSLASVRMYLNLFTGDVKKQHQRFSPLDNLAQTSAIYRACCQKPAHTAART